MEDEKDNLLTEEETYTEKLLISLKNNRDELMSLIDELETFKKNISALFPEKIDQRYVRLFEEKIKTITSLFQLILEIRKEFTRQVVQEVELRRKLKIDDSEKNIADLIDIRSIARKIEKLKETSETIN